MFEAKNTLGHLGILHDRWHDWLAIRRFGGDKLAVSKAMEQLLPIRDRILVNARIGESDRVLDVGTGDGLLAFGALSHLSNEGKVIFSDISEACLSNCREICEQNAEALPVEFHKLSADNLESIVSDTVDVVMLRSVLLYVEDKQKCFDEFYRVLSPGGRLSLYEPINEFSKRHKGPHDLYGIDLSPIASIDDKLKAGYAKFRSKSQSLMTAFTHEDLFNYASKAGFKQITLNFNAYKEQGAAYTWEIIYKAPPNPNAPTLEEVVNAVLTMEEKEVLIAFIKNAIDAGEEITYFGEAYLVAIKK